MIEAGTYRGRAKQWALGTAKTGTEQIGVTFDLLDHPGQTIMWFGYFSEKALPSTVKALRACGWVGVDLTDLAGMDDHEVNLVIEHEQDQQGQTRARVRWVNSTGGLAMENQMPGDKAKAFAARMRGQIAAAGGPPQAKTAARPAARPATHATQAAHGTHATARDDVPPPHSDSDEPPF